MDGATLRSGNGPTWVDGAVAGSNNKRGSGAGSTELELFQGVYVNKNSMQIRWGIGAGEIVTIPARQATLAGTFVTPSNGQVTDSSTDGRFLCNAYNQTERLAFEKAEVAANWNYSVEVFRVSNNNAATRLAYVQCFDGTIVKVITKTKLTSSGTTVVVAGMAIGFDGTFVETEFVSVSSARVELINLFANIVSPAGYHVIQPYEYGAGSDVQTWFGSPNRVKATVFN